jgi:hypothetical protein
MFTIREIVSFYAIIVTIMKNNNIFEDKISWYDINEKGQIKDFLNFEPTVYVYKGMDEDKSCYVGASALPKNRINSHRSRIVN